MNLATRIGAAVSAFASPERPGVMGGVPDWASYIIGHPFIPPEDLGNYRDAFRKVPVVSSSIGRIQQDFAALPRRVWMGEGDTRREMKRADGNLVDLLLKANRLKTGYQQWEDTSGSLLIAGDAYWVLEYFAGNGTPGEIWCLPSHEFRITPGVNRGILRYEYRRGGQWTVIEAERVIHFRDFNPDDEPIGMSRLEPVRRDFEAQFYALTWLKEFFRKGGMLSGVWTVSKDVQKKYTQKELDAIAEVLRKKHMGFDKAWNPVVIQGIEFIRQGMTLSEIEIDRQLGILNGNIARQLGVPPWMLGIKEGGNREGGASEDVIDYWFGTIGRTDRRIISTLNERLSPLFGRGITIETDFSGVPALREARLQQAKTAVTLTGRPVWTVNEARRFLGDMPIDDPAADELYTRPAPALGFAESAGRRLRRGSKGVRTHVIGDAPRLALPAARRQLSAKIRGDAREELRRKAGNSLNKAEAKMLAFIRGRVDAQERTVISKLRARAESARALVKGEVKLAIDLDGLMDEEGGDEARQRVRKILEQLLKERGAEAIDDLGEVAEAIEIALNSERVRRFLDTQMTRAINVPDQTTATVLRESLQEGVTANETLSDLIERVHAVFDGRRNNAATIARTETLPGYNLAAVEAWGESGVVAQKDWLSSQDDVTRPEHLEADEQDPVPIDGVFNVGGEFLQYPGDPAGSAAMTINCRCTVEPVLDVEAVKRRMAEHFWRGMEQPSLNGHTPANRIAGYLAGVK